MNEDIKKIIRDKGLYLWEVAQEYGINDCNFSRLLRYKLTDEKRNRILEAIEQAVKNKEREQHE